jgi:UDP-N-acetylglucosamine pyrophosphorylase
MRASYPGFLSKLQNQLEAQPLALLERVNRLGGLQVAELVSLILNPVDFTVDRPEDAPASWVELHEDIDPGLAKAGTDSLRDGTTAFCVLAGGAGTRIGMSKGFLKLPGTDTTLLGLKMLQAKSAKHVWVMTSPGNRAAVQDHLTAIGADKVKTFSQFESFRLTPDNQLHTVDGMPDFHPCGHGDLVPALKASGILQDFLASGGERIVVVNVDNVFGTPDPLIIGRHIASGSPVTCEVVRRQPRDSGGVLCVHQGIPQVVEQFRLSSDTDPTAFEWLNTNSMVFNADLDFDSLQWSWHRVKKSVDGKAVVQYERLLQDLTAHFRTQFIGVTRASRYMPVKTADDLQEAARILGKKAA